MDTVAPSVSPLLTEATRQGAAGASQVQAAVGQFADYLLTYFLALAAVGALAMALIELWKKLRDTRTRFHARSVTAWLQATLDETLRRQAGSIRKGKLPPLSGRRAYEELIQLTTGVALPAAGRVATSLNERRGRLEGWRWLDDRPEFALFALELGKMMGHVQDAADIALNNPARYPNLYLFMTNGADPDDVADWYVQAETMLSGRTLDRARVKERAGLFARLQQVTRRKLDAFQLYTGYRWANRNILAANIVGIVVLFGVLTWVNRAEGLGMRAEVVVLLSLLGGILSPLAKDIVTALEKVRKGG
jgi:hypothetical protein